MSGSILDGLDSGHRALLGRVQREAERRRLPLYLVGGPVRDWLLGRTLRDLDLLLEAPAAEAASLSEQVAKAGGEVEFHERFGTAHLVDGDASLDLAAVRRESYARAGALPVVEAGSFEEDLRRRDFTVNAMAYPLSSRGAERLSKGQSVIDLAGGREDLARGVLRVFHPRSFHDDPTRGLRAARLAARFGFRLARGTRNALRGSLEDGAFLEVSGERVRREFQHLFLDARLGSDPVRALLALDRWEILETLCPGLEVPRGVRVPLRRLGRVVAQPPWPLAETRVWLSALSLWCEGLGLTIRRGLVERLSLRGRNADWVLRFAREGGRELARCERARGRGALDRELEPLTPEVRLAIYAKADAPLRQRVVRWVTEDQKRRPPISGRDLGSLGLEGASVGDGLLAVRAAWLDGKLTNRAEALAFATEWAHRALRRSRKTARNSTKKHS